MADKKKAKDEAEAKQAEPEQAQAGAEDEQRFAIQRIYAKDVSFEAPNTPQIFQQEWKPQIELELNSVANKVADNTHEVVLRIIVTAKVDDKIAFLVEAHQAGIFTMENFEENQLHQVLGSYCPNILFPYARELVSDAVLRGGFPQLNIAPVNFDALYAQHLQKMAEDAEQPSSN